MGEDELERRGEGTGHGPDGSSAGDGVGTKWVVGTLFAAAGLAVAVAMAWYAAEGYRQAGGASDGAAESAAGARAEAPAASEGRARVRSKSGRSRWLSIPAPVITFRTLAGDTASLGGLRGRVVVLNFWATWCPPCKREIPELSRLQDSLSSEGASVVGVAVSSGSRQEIQEFGEEYGINYPVWLSDPGTAATEYRAVGLPTTLLVDRRGGIRRRYMGAQTYEVLSDDVRALLDSSSAPPGPEGTDPARQRRGPTSK